MGQFRGDPNLYDMFAKLNARIELLERSVRFNVPRVSTDPAHPQKGDVWINTTSNLLKAIDNTGATRTITWV